MTMNEATERQFGETAMTFLHDLKVAIRSLSRAKGLTLTVVLTLALGSAPTPPSLPWYAEFYCGRW